MQRLRHENELQINKSASTFHPKLVLGSSLIHNRTSSDLNSIDHRRTYGALQKRKVGILWKVFHSNNYVSFDFAVDSPIDHFFVIFKWKQTAADGELPEVKMYAEMESWKWQVKGDFFNSMGRKRLLAPKATCNWLGTGLAGTVMMVWMLLWGVNT